LGQAGARHLRADRQQQIRRIARRIDSHVHDARRGIAVTKQIAVEGDFVDRQRVPGEKRPQTGQDEEGGRETWRGETRGKLMGG